jgi:DNA polymerase (family 10)
MKVVDATSMQENRVKKAATSNDEIADTLDHVADLLELEGESSFRVRSYRNAAQTIRDLDTPVSTLMKQDGEHVLKDLPGIGDRLAGSIKEIVTTGRLGLAERLEHETWPGQLFTEVPGIGPELARRIHDRLGITTLEELEVAAHDGRLEQVEGIGPQRAEGVRIALAGMLSQSSRRRLRQALPEETPKQERPSVGLLLEIDEEYRRKAERDQLRKIAPKRFNPEGKAWLPVMHTKRQGWSFTVLFSNTALAHRSGKTHDWVVIYCEKTGEQQQGTVVTAERGPLSGKRVIRGRERECREYYGV